MKTIIVVISFFLSSFILGQESGRVSITGDADLDNFVAEINTKATDDYDGFKKDMNMKFGISSTEVDRYVKQEKINPGDLYYGYSLSQEINKPISDVMKSYKKNKAWGKVAQDFGIKPGSEQFHNFKSHTLKGKNPDAGNNSKDVNKNQNKIQEQNQNQIQKQNKNDSGNSQENINKGKK